MILLDRFARVLLMTNTPDMTYQIVALLRHYARACSSFFGIVSEIAPDEVVEAAQSVYNSAHEAYRIAREGMNGTGQDGSLRTPGVFFDIALQTADTLRAQSAIIELVRETYDDDTLNFIAPHIEEWMTAVASGSAILDEYVVND